MNLNALIRTPNTEHNMSVSNSSVPSPHLQSRFKDSATLQQVATGQQVLARKSEGEAVVRIQQALSDLGFYRGDQADGKFGFQTEMALKNFQSSQKLPQSGKVDQKTFQALNKVTPPPGLKLWETPNKDQLSPSNDLGKLGKARAVIDLSEHRLFLYDEKNKIKKIYSVATGDPNHPDGKGKSTETGIRKVFERIADPSPIGRSLWGNPGVFGTRMLDLSALDEKKGTWWHIGEELHGTYDRRSIGTDASHGCIRMQNEDIEEVYRQLKAGDLIKIQR
jgi:lipoprotein-anchoring transpeptidase ErfK/SrfK